MHGSSMAWRVRLPASRRDRQTRRRRRRRSRRGCRRRRRRRRRVRHWRRRATYPRPPAARSATDMPPSTRRGIGTDDGPRRVDVRRRLRVAAPGASVSTRAAARPAPGSRAVAGCRILPAGCEMAVEGGLQRARDDVLGVRVRADVRRDCVDRLLVAVVRVEAVDAAVVEPVAEHLLATRCRRARGRRRRTTTPRSSARRRPARGTRGTDDWLSRVRSHGEKPEAPGVRSLPTRGEAVVWAE